MTNPVVAADGYSYDEKAFLQYLNTGGTNSPITGLALKNKDFFYNQALKVIISEWKPGRESKPSILETRDANSIAQRVREEFKKNATLLHSAKNQDIVAFLGNTGAGKSTLVNLLAGKELKVSQDGEDYVLVNPNDKTAMAIGTGGNSETLYPKSIDVDGLRFFDLPGFNDTDGSERNLVNAAFTRQILMDAASVRLVFVAGQDQFTTDRGASVRQMFYCIKQLFVTDQSINLVDEGVFVATKTTCTEQTDMIDFLLKKTASNDEVLNDQLKSWNKKNRLCRMFHPIRSVDSNQKGVKDQILKLIKGTEPAKIVGINVSVLYPPETKGSLERMFLNVLDGILDSKIKTPLTTLPDYDKAIAIYSFEGFWQAFNIDVCKEDEAIGLLKDLCVNPYNKAFKTLEKENEGKRQTHIKDLKDKRQELEAKYEEIYQEFLSKILDSKIKVPSITLPDYDKAIAIYTTGFWQAFNTEVCKEDKAIDLLKELCIDKEKAFKTFEKENEIKRQTHIKDLKDKRQERIWDIEKRTKIRTKEVINLLVPKKNGDKFVSFDFAYHRDFYDQVCGENSINKLATDLSEQEIARSYYAGYISEHSHKQMMLWHKMFGRDEIEKLTQRLNLLEEKGKEESVVVKYKEVKQENIEKILMIPELAKGYEEIYQRFFKGELIYRPKGIDKTEGEIRLRIADLKNPLEGTFDLSQCRDAGNYLSINTGYRKGKKQENANKVEIWLTPRFLVEKEQSESAKHLQPIMSKWSKDISVGVLYTWGGCDDMSYFDYNVITSDDLMSKKNLYEIYEKSGWGIQVLSWESVAVSPERARFMFCS